VTDIGAQVANTLNVLMGEFDIITQNLANVSTTGYKRRCTNFSAALAAQTGDGIDAAGTKPIVGGDIDFSQGRMIQTGQPLDVALNGKGFFVIETRDGPLYTRHGIFQVNQNGQVVDAQGRLAAGDGGPLVVPAEVDVSDVQIGTDGRLFARGAQIGQFRIVDFPGKTDQLVPAGLGCYQAPKDLTPAGAETVMVKQGYQEGSNVQMVEELVNMIMVSRIYEANAKLVNTKKDTGTTAIGVAMG
jgi:flagellar basal-body rod protein FlgF